MGKTGAVSITGKLADGTSFSSSSALVGGTTADNQFVVYDGNLYSNVTGKQGVLSGVLTLGRSAFVLGFNGLRPEIAAPVSGEVLGMLLWSKPATKGPYYAGRFDTELGVEGRSVRQESGVPNHEWHL